MPRTPTPESRREKDLADHKRRKYLRDTGRPSLVPMEPARERVRSLHAAYGMSSRDIAQATDLSQSTVSDLIRGYRVPTKGGEQQPIKKIPRTTHDKVISFTPDSTFYNPRARMDPTSTHRKLQALCTLGYGAKHLSILLGHDSWNQTWRLMRGREVGWAVAKNPGSYVELATRDAIAELYAKYVDVDPMDVGGTLLSVSRAKKLADTHGFVPPMCWDDDTIGEPDAFPEWTGACGTVEGYFLHLKYDIHVRGYAHSSATPEGKQKRKVLCRPCLGARSAADPTVNRSVINDDGIAEALKSGRVYRDIAAEFDVSTRTVQRVANELKAAGVFNPKSGPRVKEQPE